MHFSVLLPGGDVSFEAPDGYGAAGRIIYDIAAEMNNQGDFMPIWGTCLGFEFLAYLTSKSGNPLVNCSSYQQAVPLEFVKSKVYKYLISGCGNYSSFSLLCY